MTEEASPMSPEDALAVSIGENALGTIGRSGLHAMAVGMSDDYHCDLIVVPDHEVTMDELIEWEGHVGQLNILFHGEALIELRIMSVSEYHALNSVDGAEYPRTLVQA